jgi:hypothetical protein
VVYGPNTTTARWKPEANQQLYHGSSGKEKYFGLQLPTLS